MSQLFRQGSTSEALSAAREGEPASPRHCRPHPEVDESALPRPAEAEDGGVGTLCARLEDADGNVVAAAATALGEIGDPRAVPLLIEALRRQMMG
ncbi:MAG: HEAT repeat domain-containing protein, partial [Armatimonadetes bacterium]|nr:HEAT repeat domain-containing protein [Armatimonadota bacterium]